MKVTSVSSVSQPRLEMRAFTTVVGAHFPALPERAAHAKPLKRGARSRVGHDIPSAAHCPNQRLRYTVGATDSVTMIRIAHGKPSSSAWVRACVLREADGQIDRHGEHAKYCHEGRPREWCRRRAAANLLRGRLLRDPTLRGGAEFSIVDVGCRRRGCAAASAAAAAGRLSSARHAAGASRSAILRPGGGSC